MSVLPVSFSDKETQIHSIYCTICITLSSSGSSFSSISHLICRKIRFQLDSPPQKIESVTSLQTGTQNYLKPSCFVHLPLDSCWKAVALFALAF